MSELEPVIVYAFIARLGERFILSMVVISIALVSMIAFWRSVQRIEFSLSKDNLGTSANIALATPLLVLLVVVAFAYVSFAHPVSVTLPERAAGGDPETSGAPMRGASLTGAAGMGAQPIAGDDTMRLSRTRTALRSLNCIVRASPDLSPRDANAVDSAKVALILDVWQSNWGDPAAFETWALNGRGPQPATEVIELYQGVHELC